MLVVIFLEACNHLPQRPKVVIYQLDRVHNTCYGFQMPKEDNQDWLYLGEFKLQDCVKDKNYVLTPANIQVLKNYLQDVKKWGERNCQP